LLDATKRNNLERSSSLRQTVTGAKIVAFAVADSDEEVIACAEAGISGYISHRGSVEDVVAAVDAAVFGELHCSPRTSALLFSRIAQVCGKRDPLVGQEILTSREKEIVALVERGLSNKEIARSLRIGTATVKNHIHNILNKLDVRRRGEAAAWLRRANKGAPLMGVMLGVFSAATKVMDELWAGFCTEGLNSLVVALT
jgi:DNA-binding NarL/FixJ family response regulator